MASEGQRWGHRNPDCIEWGFVAVMQHLVQQDSRSVVAGVDMVGNLGIAVVVAEPDRTDIAGSVFVEVVAAELGRVDIAEVVAVELGKVGIVEAVAAELGKVGIAAVDRHRLVVLWLPSYIVVQFVVGFLNSCSCLGWLNYIVDYSNPHWTLVGLMLQVLETHNH